MSSDEWAREKAREIARQAPFHLIEPGDQDELAKAIKTALLAAEQRGRDSMRPKFGSDASTHYQQPVNLGDSND